MVSQLIAATVAAVLLAATSLGLGSDNFRAQHADPRYARRVEQVAEQARQASARFWTGQEIPTWNQPCPIRASFATGSGGATTFVFDRGEVSGWSMTIQGARDEMLSAIVPHEVDHTVRASLLRRCDARWVDEGCASLWESAAMHVQFRETVRQSLAGAEADVVFRYFDAREYPGGAHTGFDYSRTVWVFYCQSFSVVEYLLQAKGPSALLDFQRDVRKPSEKLLSYYEMTVPQLRQRWQEWFLARAAKGLDCESFDCCQHCQGVWQDVAYRAAGDKPELIAFVQPGCPSCLKFKKDVTSGAYNDYQVVWVERSSRTGWRFDQLDLYLEFRASQKNPQGQPWPPPEPISVLTLWLRGSPCSMTGYDPPERIKLWLSQQRPAKPAKPDKVIERPAPERFQVEVQPPEVAPAPPPPAKPAPPASPVAQPAAPPPAPVNPPARPALPASIPTAADPGERIPGERIKPAEVVREVAADVAGGASAIGTGAKVGGAIGAFFGPAGIGAGTAAGALAGVGLTWLRMRRRKSSDGSGVPSRPFQRFARAGIKAAA